MRRFNELLTNVSRQTATSRGKKVGRSTISCLTESGRVASAPDSQTTGGAGVFTQK